MSDQHDQRRHVGVYSDGEWTYCWCLTSHDHLLEDDQR